MLDGFSHDIRESTVDMVTLHDLLNPELLTDCHHNNITKLWNVIEGFLIKV